MSKTADQFLGTPSLLRRLTTIFYDTWLVLACLLAVSAMVIGLRVLTDGDAMHQGEVAVAGVWKVLLFSASLITVFGFYSYFWLKCGQTLGMQTWRIKLVNENGELINLKQAFIRFIAAFFSLALLGLGYFWQLLDKDKKSLHDRISKTQLVLVEKRKG
jgi:uncharacterized RDD family membrane protein YckC